MGYGIKQTDDEIFIASELENDTKKALELYNNTNFPNIEDAFKVNRFGIEKDSDGNIIHIYFTGEKKWDVDDILKAIAPFVKENSFLEFIDDEDDMWRCYFRGKKLKIVIPKITWE